MWFCYLVGSKNELDSAVSEAGEVGEQSEGRRHWKDLFSFVAFVSLQNSWSCMLEAWQPRV